MAYGNSAYGNLNYLEEKVLSASPLEIVAMLYSKAVAEIREARRQLAAGDIALRSRAISKACDAIGELDSSLDMEAGGDLSTRLRGLYRYCLGRLLEANAAQADGPLVEVLGLLSTLSEAWQTVAKQDASSQSMASTAGAAARWEAAVELNDSEHSWTL